MGASLRPEWWFETAWARHRKYGIQPTSPSVRKNFSCGKSAQNSAQISPVKVNMLIINDAVICTLGGASVDTCGDRDAEPTCVHSTVLFSQTASNNGYQYLV